MLVLVELVWMGVACGAPNTPGGSGMGGNYTVTPHGIEDRETAQ